MKKLFYPLVVGALLVAGGCSDDDGLWRDRTIAFADIVDAESLYLTGADATRASDGETQPAFFKVTFDGSTEEVIFTDENGKNVDVEVLSFCRLSDNYLYFLLHIDNSGDIRSWKHLIIRRSDGAVFKMDYNAFGSDYYRTRPIIDTETEVRTDYNDNVYFGRYWGDIYKIYTHGNEVYGTMINRNDMYSQNWLVDRRGNVLINNEYIRLVSGEFARYSEARSYKSFYAWNDSEGFYYSDGDNPPKKEDQEDRYYSTPYKITYCRPTSPTSTFETIKTFELFHQSYYDKFDFMPLVYKDKTVLFQEKENNNNPEHRYRIDIYDKDRIELHEMEYHPLPDGIRFEYYGQKYPHTERYLYGMSESEIWRLDVETGVPEMLYKYDNEFVIKSMTVRNDIVTFTAFELRRGNDVVAEIYPDKSVKVLESTNGDKIIYFERLN